MLPPTDAATVDLTGGHLPDAAWTWFTDPRAVVDPDAPDGPRTLAGFVTADGDVAVCWRDAATGETGATVLHADFEADDHDVPALHVRPDGRYLAVYARHHADPHLRWRVSTDPGDPTAWRDERSLDLDAPVTYANLHPTGDGGDRLACLTRARNWNPVLCRSDDAGSSWTEAGEVLTWGDEGCRPYVRYAGDGERLHLVATEDHPRDHPTGQVHGVLDGGEVARADGSVVGTVGDDPASVADLTPVHGPGEKVDDTYLTRAWPLDHALDGEDRPVAVFQARAEDDPADHRFCWARLEDGEWEVRALCRGGPGLYDREADYTGLAALDPADPTRVVVSTPVDPRDGDDLAYHELFQGETADGGRYWTWTALTPDADADNLRPVVPDARDESAALLWMRGEYRTYLDWDTQVVGRFG